MVPDKRLNASQNPLTTGSTKPSKLELSLMTFSRNNVCFVTKFPSCFFQPRRHYNLFDIPFWCYNEYSAIPRSIYWLNLPSASWGEKSCRILTRLLQLPISEIEQWTLTTTKCDCSADSKRNENRTGNKIVSHELKDPGNKVETLSALVLQDAQKALLILTLSFPPTILNWELKARHKKR